jgi:hypothetical protein
MNKPAPAWLIIASLLSLAAPLAAELNHPAEFPAGATDLQQQFAKPDTETSVTVVTEQSKPKQTISLRESKNRGTPFVITLSNDWQYDERSSYISILIDKKGRSITINSAGSKKSPDEAIDEYITGMNARLKEAEPAKLCVTLPQILKVEDFATKSGFTGRLVHIGKPQQKVWKQQFFFNYQDTLYCLQMSILGGGWDEDWAELHNIVINTLKPVMTTATPRIIL